MRQTALITGAGRGIGRAIAIKLSQTMDLILLGRQRLPLKETKRLCSEKAQVAFHVFDLSEPKLLPHLFDEMFPEGSAKPEFQVLINNAGLCFESSIYDADLTDWDAALDVNLRSIIHLTKLSLPSLKQSAEKFGSSAIINIASLAGHRTYANGANYCATKWGLLGFSGSLFEDVRNDGIKVCCISPGYVNTDMQYGKPLNIHDMIQPEDIADTVKYVLDMPSHVCPSEIVLLPQKDPRGKR